MDVDARIQLFDLKTKYQFLTTPAWDRYNMPLYSVQSETPGNPNSPDIGMFPVYQGFTGPAYINGIQVPLQTQKNSFFNIFPNVVQNLQVVATGNGSAGPYTFKLPIGNNNAVPLNPPINGITRGHVDILGIMSTGVNVDPPVANNATFATLLGKIPTTSIDSAVFISATASDGSNISVQDSGIFLENNLDYGMLMAPGKAPYGNAVLSGGYSINSNTFNYLTGQCTVTFPAAVPVGSNIIVECFYFQGGLPRGILFYNNTLTLRMPPALQYLVELDAFLSPAAFFNTSAAIPFGYMAEYIARGAARKILSDTGDIEQFQFYEPLFNEQEKLVWKRSQRQWTSTRTETIYSQGFSQGLGNNSFGGGGTL